MLEAIFFNQRNNGAEWNQFVIENNGNFLQSFEWGEFQEKFRAKIYRIEVKEKHKILLRAQIVQKKNWLKAYFYIPYGPVLNLNISQQEKQKALILFLNKIQELARKENAIFLRIEPITSLPDLSGFCFQDQIKRVQPKKTLLLDLKKTEQEIFNNFNKGTRYNIRLAEKKGVKMKVSHKYSDVFYNLMKQTKKRQGFRAHAEKYYRKLLDIDTRDFNAELFLAEYNNKVITASIVIFFGKRATSLHAVSDYKYRALKTVEFLHWQKILLAKKMGFKEYDFWGIDEKKWPGITHFKKGFRGKEFEYAQGKNIIFQNYWYKIYSIAKKFL